MSENTQRKDFSLEEIIQIKKAVEPEIKIESKKRKLSGKPSAKLTIMAQSGRRGQLTSANEIAEGEDDKQLEKLLDEPNRELSDKTSQIAKLSDDLRKVKEKEAAAHKVCN